MKTLNFRQKVFKRAYAIMNATKKSFAVCLSKAWAIYRLMNRMKKSETQFTYEKKDGSLRHATGFLKDLPQTISKAVENFKTVAYFDIEKQSFRRFKVESLITIIK